MNIANLQATLRHFAAEREWQPFHTPKNLATALMVEAAELAEVFQWMTPEESREAHLDVVSKQRIGEEIADVLLYLLQVADHTQVDVEQAVKDKLVRNAQKYPAKRVVAVVEPVESQLPDTHILLDYENVQPTEVELRAMVPEATRVWVFHGPHQKQVEQRFASFGTGMTTVPISKTGKNALDFHLSFYMGYIASRNQQAKFVVVANDKGYEPMLEHAKVLGFAVRQHGHARSAEPVVQKVVATAGSAASGARCQEGCCEKGAGQESCFQAYRQGTRREEGRGEEDFAEEGGCQESAASSSEEDREGEPTSEGCKAIAGDRKCAGQQRVGGVFGHVAEDDRQSAQDG